MQYQKARIVRVYHSQDLGLRGTYLWVRYGPPQNMLIRGSNGGATMVSLVYWTDIPDDEMPGSFRIVPASVVELQPEFKD